MSKDVQYLDLFLEMLSAEKGSSKNTLMAYQKDLKNFFEKTGHKAEAINYEDLQTYLVSLTDQGFQQSTLSRKKSCLRQYFLFLQKEGIRTDNPAKLLKVSKIQRPLPKVLSAEDMMHFLDFLSKQTTMEGIRLYAMVELLYGTGLRVSELVTLPLKSITNDLEGEKLNTALIIKGKGGKERLLPLNDITLKALKAYLPYRSLYLKKSPLKGEIYFFPSSSKDGHVTRQRFAQLLKEYATLAGLRGADLSPHTIRHAFATHLLQNGANLMVIQKLLGHQDISTTQIYTHVQPEHLKDLVETYHPLAS